MLYLCFVLFFCIEFLFYVQTNTCIIALVANDYNYVYQCVHITCSEYLNMLLFTHTLFISLICSYWYITCKFPSIIDDY